MNDRKAKLTQGNRARRPRWARVRIQTAEGAFAGTIRLEPGRTSLYELLDDGRCYLTIWAAGGPGSHHGDGCIALHKSAIQSIVLDVGSPPGRDRGDQ